MLLNATERIMDIVRLLHLLFIYTASCLKCKFVCSSVKHLFISDSMPVKHNVVTLQWNEDECIHSLAPLAFDALSKDMIRRRSVFIFYMFMKMLGCFSVCIFS